MLALLTYGYSSDSGWTITLEFLETKAVQSCNVTTTAMAQNDIVEKKDFVPAKKRFLRSLMELKKDCTAYVDAMQLQSLSDIAIKFTLRIIIHWRRACVKKCCTCLSE